ncbi:MAG: molybdopterin-binding protein [Pseudolabrys sp.]
MAISPDALQMIARLTPLAEVLAMVDLDVKPVGQRTIDVFAGAGRVLAADANAPARPSAAIALQDGWALAADDTIGAGGYTPTMLMRVPPRVEVGQAMPAGTDSVAPLDAVKVSAGQAEALVTVNPGDGVLPAGGDADPAIPLRRAGERLQLTDLAAFSAAGIARVVVREPRVRVLPLRGNGIVAAAGRLIVGDCERRGGAARLDEGGRGLAVALAAETADAIVAIGGTGTGRNDNSVHMLTREGRVAVHGMAIAPGETAALGFAGARPVLLLPGRLDAALAVWLTVGRRMLDRLAGAAPKEHEGAETLPLARKVASTVGLAELVPVRRIEGQAEPLASRYLSVSALARSDGWVLVPAESEGYSAGASVQVRPWP